jgi:hypothetical protein
MGQYNELMSICMEIVDTDFNDQIALKNLIGELRKLLYGEEEEK